MRQPERLSAILDLIEEQVADEFAEELAIQEALHPEKLSATELECTRRILKIYEIAHAFNTRHSCYHVHTDWRRLADEQIARNALLDYWEHTSYGSPE